MLNSILSSHKTRVPVLPTIVSKSTTTTQLGIEEEEEDEEVELQLLGYQVAHLWGREYSPQEVTNGETETGNPHHGTHYALAVVYVPAVEAMDLLVDCYLSYWTATCRAASVAAIIASLPCYFSISIKELGVLRCLLVSSFEIIIVLVR